MKTAPDALAERSLFPDPFKEFPMSDANAPSPAAAWGQRLRPDSLAGWLVGGVLVVALAVAFAVAVWPASEADKAREDGERLGTAVSALYNADTPEEVDLAVVDVRDAAADTREHAGDAVAEQVSDQADALERAADGFVGERTADDSFEQDLYHSELDVALGDLEDQAQSFRDDAPEVEQAFWDGYETGISGNAEPTTTSSLD
jgi:hypothetical protein